MNTGTVVRLVALAGLAACADNTTAPLESEVGVVAPQFAVAMSVGNDAALDFSTDLENLRIAVLPTFADAASAEAIKAKLDTLQEQLGNGDRTAATGTLAEIRAAIKPDASDPTTLGYVEMVFSSIDSALGTK